MNILGIETSCDETAAALVRGRRVLHSVVFSQAKLHGPYGGVVPEIASRSHLESLWSVVEEALSAAGKGWPDVDAVAATYGPGLASSLLVGLAMAKGLALRLDRPLCAVNHLEAHLYSVFLGADRPSPEELCPFLSLIVSGGHTCLVRVAEIGGYELLGQTVDDAAGEAFDKGANLLGLGYPGGPAIDRVSAGGDAGFIKFPRGRQKSDRFRFGDMDPDLCFSFSGVKTALLYYLKEHPLSAGGGELASLAASYQEAIVDALVQRCDRAVRAGETLSVVGGVSLNSRLRSRLGELAQARSLRLVLPEPQFCADNAAMVAAVAAAGQGIWGEAAMSVDADPNLEICADSG
ncbi:tRNA (adenosine(37)-N6)-threonylcarbamoyltransferase complex transferase subunit TsaD [Verrucomicrobiota bacterium]